MDRGRWHGPAAPCPCGQRFWPGRRLRSLMKKGAARQITHTMATMRNDAWTPETEACAAGMPVRSAIAACMSITVSNKAMAMAPEVCRIVLFIAVPCGIFGPVG